MNQRNLMFRAWDTATDPFTLIDQGFHILGEVTIFDMLKQWKQSFERFNDILIEQYIGLEDKNGKHIYEGDIVRAVGWKPEEFEIKFIEGAFCGWGTTWDSESENAPYPIDINMWYTSKGCGIEIVENVHGKT